MSPSNGKKHSKKAKHTNAGASAPSNASQQLPSVLEDTSPSPTNQSASSTQDPIVAALTFLCECSEDDDLLNISHFFDVYASEDNGRNLKVLWDFAFKSGRDQGVKDLQSVWDDTLKEQYLRGKSRGREEGRHAAQTAGYNMFELGRKSERQDWTEAGHGDHCLAAPGRITSDGSSQTDSMPTPPPGFAVCCHCALIPVAILDSQGVQTDPEVPSPPSLIPSPQPTSSSDSSTQTETSTPTPTSAPVPCTLDSLPELPPPTHPVPIDWADDTASIPIKSLEPRDLSCLRSSPSSNPFASFQVRVKKSTPRQSRRSRFHISIVDPPQLRSQHYYRIPKPPGHRRFVHSVLPYDFPKPTPAPTLTSDASQLDWEQDPQLSDLSRALKALGWVRP